jgi:hypothetical protein
MAIKPTEFKKRFIESVDELEEICDKQLSKNNHSRTSTITIFINEIVSEEHIDKLRQRYCANGWQNITSEYFNGSTFLTFKF